MDIDSGSTAPKVKVESPHSPSIPSNNLQLPNVQSNIPVAPGHTVQVSAAVTAPSFKPNIGAQKMPAKVAAGKSDLSINKGVLAPKVEAPKIDSSANISVHPNITKPEGGKINIHGSFKTKSKSSSSSSSSSGDEKKKNKIGIKAKVDLALPQGEVKVLSPKVEAKVSSPKVEGKVNTGGLKIEHHEVARGTFGIHTPATALPSPSVPPVPSASLPKPQVNTQSNLPTVQANIQLPHAHIRAGGKSQASSSSSSSSSESEGKEKKKRGISIGGKLEISKSNSSKDLKGKGSAKVECNLCKKGFGVFKKSYVCTNCNKVICDSCSSKYRSKIIFQWPKSAAVCTTCLPSVKTKWLAEYNKKVKANPSAMFFDASEEAVDFLSQVPVSMTHQSTSLSFGAKKQVDYASSDEDKSYKLDASKKSPSIGELNVSASGQVGTKGFGIHADLSVSGKGDVHSPKVKLPKLGGNGSSSSSSSSSEDDGTGKRIKKPNVKVSTGLKIGGAKLAAPKVDVKAPKHEGEGKGATSPASPSVKVDAKAGVHLPKVKAEGGMKMPNFGAKGGLSSSSSSSEDDGTGRRVKKIKGGVHAQITIPDLEGKGSIKSPNPISHVPTASANTIAKTGDMDIGAKGSGGVGIKVPKFGRGDKDSSSSSSDEDSGKKVKISTGFKLGSTSTPKIDAEARGIAIGLKKNSEIKESGGAQVAADSGDKGGGFGIKMPKFGRGGSHSSSSSSEDDGTGKRVKKVKGKVDVSISSPKIDVKGGIKVGGEAKAPKVEGKGSVGVDVEAKGRVDAGGKGSGGFGLKMPKFGFEGGSHSSSSSSSEDDGTGKKVKKGSKLGASISIPSTLGGKSEVDVTGKPTLAELDAQARQGPKVSVPGVGGGVKVGGGVAIKGDADISAKGSGGFGIKVPKFGKGNKDGSSSSSEDDGTGKRVKKPPMKVDAKIGGVASISTDAKVGGDAKASGGFGIKMPKFGLGGDSSSSEDDGTGKRVKKVKGPKMEAKLGAKPVEVKLDVPSSPKPDVDTKGVKIGSNIDVDVKVKEVKGDAGGGGKGGIGLRMPKFGKGGYSSSSSSSEDDGTGKRVKKAKVNVKVTPASVPSTNLNVGKPSIKGNVDVKATGGGIKGSGDVKVGAEVKMVTDIHGKGGIDAGGKGAGGFGLKMPKFGKGGHSSSSSSSEDDGTGKRVKKVKGSKVTAGASTPTIVKPEIAAKGGIKVSGDMKLGGKADLKASGGADAAKGGGFGIKIPKFGRGKGSDSSSSSSEDDGTGVKKVKGGVKVEANISSPNLSANISKQPSVGGITTGGDIKAGGKVDLKASGGADLQPKQGGGKGGFGLKMPKFGMGKTSDSSSSSEDGGSGKRVKKVKGGGKVETSVKGPKIEGPFNVQKEPIVFPKTEVKGASGGGALKASPSADLNLKGGPIKASPSVEIGVKGNADALGKGGFGLKMPKFGKGGGHSSSSSSSEDDGTGKRVKKNKAIKLDASLSGPTVGGKADAHAQGGVELSAKAGMKAGGDVTADTSKGGGFGIKIPKFGIGGGHSSSSSEDDGTGKRVKKVKGGLQASVSVSGPKIDAKTSGDLNASPSAELTVKGGNKGLHLPGFGKAKKSKEVKAEWKRLTIESGRTCFVCSTNFSSTKRPHKCSECAAEVCSSCNYPHLKSFVLGWKHSKKVCVNCCNSIKLQITAKVKDNAGLKAEAAKELQNWLVQPPSLRIAKRRDGKDGSESSSSSSSSSDEDTKLKIDIASKIPKPAKGECQICLKVFGMFKRPLSCHECDKTVCDGCSDKFYSKLVFGWVKSNIICFTCLPLVKQRWYEEYTKKLAIDSAFTISMESESSDFMSLVPSLKKDPSRGKIGELDISLKGSADVNKPKLEYKMSRRTLDISVRKTKEEKALAKLRWKKTTIEGGGKCNVCASPFSLTRRPHECKMCGIPSCSSCCTNTSLTIVLGWTRPQKICIKCLPSIREQINFKVKEKPELKAQADKEFDIIKQWQALSPQLRVPKKKQGDGSESSSSSSSSDSGSDKDKKGKSKIGFAMGIGSPKSDGKGGFSLGFGGGKTVKKEHKSKKMKIEWKNTAITDGKICLGCKSKFATKKRPHQCADCHGLFCSSCSTLSFTSVLLGWKKPKRLCEKCVTNLKAKIETQASFSDNKAQVQKETKELSAWLSLAPHLRIPKRKDGKSGSDTSDSSSSSSESSEDEKHKKLPPDCTICHKEFNLFKKSLLCFHCLSYVCDSCSDKLHSRVILGWDKPNVVCLSCLTQVKLKWKEEHTRKLKMNSSLTFNKDDESAELCGQVSSPNFSVPSAKVKTKPLEGKKKLKFEWRDKILNSGGSCTACKTKFTSTRRPHECKECSTTVCSGCSKGSFISSVLGWTHAHRLCVKCLPKMRTKIETKASHNPALKIQGDKELADIDGWLSLSPALRIPKRKDGKEGSESSSSSSSEDEKNKGTIALKANANVKAPEVSVGGKGKLEVRGGVSNNNNRNKRVSVKQDNIIRLGAICSMCSVKFSFFKRPHQCKECKMHVCSGCSTGGIVSIVLGWGGKPRRVCGKCVSEIKKKLEKRATLMPELKIQAEKEAKELEYRMSVKIDKKNRKEEESSSSSDSDDGIGFGFKTAGNIKGKAPEFPDYKPVSLSCKVCHKNFNSTLKAALCGNCSGEVCHTCTSSLHSKLLGWTTPKIVCEDCLPAVKSKWLIEKEKQINLNSGFKVDSNLEAPFFTIFDAPKGGKVQGGAGINVAGPKVGVSSPNIGVAGPKVQGNVGISSGGISGGISTGGGMLKSSSNTTVNVGASAGGKVKKSKVQKKQIKIEIKQKSISSGNGCSLCQNKFSLSKRPHECFECHNEICSSCSNNTFSSFALGFTKPHRLCETCVLKYKTKLNAKLKERPELKEQVDKELRGIFI